VNGRTLIRVAVCAGIALGAVAFVSNERANAGTVPRRAPKTIEIKMTVVDGRSAYEPTAVTVIPGDTVKWVAVMRSHNVQFWADSVPPAAVAMLKKDIGNDTLATVRYPTAGQSFSLVMKDYPKGVYKYFCTPHLRMGMVAKLTVE
jgi:plastocyanin